MLQRLQSAAASLVGKSAGQSEHEAAVELLVLVMFSDHRVSLSEQDTLAGFDHAHPWDSDTFSFQAYLGTATARVRAAMDDEGRVAALLDDIASRLHDRDLRDELLAACQVIAEADGAVDASEHRLLGQVRDRLG